jgi:catalytic LigB subunit of aromatic ring-opening dioxygenase
VAELAVGIGMSHGPMVMCEAPTWLRMGELDRHSTLLIDTGGRPVTFEELARVNGERYAEQARLERLERQHAQVQQSLARIKDDFRQAAPDVVVVVGDDQLELFDHDNMPALAVYFGEEVVSATRTRRGRYGDRIPGGLEDVNRGYGMDRHHRWPGHQPFALHLISTLLERHFDVSAVSGVPDPERGGIGHAFGVVETQLMDERKLPLVPVLVNTYWPPNQLAPARCYELGLALREAIEAYPEGLRVALVASGGLSHFVTDEELDRRTLDALRAGDAQALCRLPAHLLNSGNSEVRNWIVVAAACQDLALGWDEYIPVYRTAAGTGCGLAFARWAAGA